MKLLRYGNTGFEKPGLMDSGPMWREDSREFIQTHSFGQSAQSAPFYLDRTLTSDIPGPSN